MLVFVYFSLTRTMTQISDVFMTSNRSASKVRLTMRSLSPCHPRHHLHFPPASSGWLPNIPRTIRLALGEHSKPSSLRLLLQGRCEDAALAGSRPCSPQSGQLCSFCGVLRCFRCPCSKTLRNPGTGIKRLTATHIHVWGIPTVLVHIVHRRLVLPLRKRVFGCEKCFGEAVQFLGAVLRCG